MNSGQGFASAAARFSPGPASPPVRPRPPLSTLCTRPRAEPNPPGEITFLK